MVLEMRKMKDSGIEWIGEIPEGWEVATIGHLFSVTAGGDAKPHLYSFVQDAKHPYPVYTNSSNPNQIYAYTSAPIFNENTITVTGRGDIGHAFYRNTKFDAIIRLLVLAPKSALDCRYYAYWIDNVSIFFTNSAAVGQLSAQQISPYKTCYLPLCEQQSIANHLDFYCSKIEHILAEIQNNIQEYKKLKQAVITQAVTKGVRGKREMKDSGVEWAGLVPHHWGVAKIGSIGQTSSGATPLRSKEASFFDDATIRWVRTLDLNDGLVYDSSEKITELALASSACSIMPKGTVCVAMYGGAGTIGKCGLLMSDCATNQAVCSIVCNREIVSPIFLLMQLLALKSYWMKYAVGTRKDPNISQDVVARMKILIPPLDEQKEITDYLDAKCAEIDGLIAKKEQLVKELESYKKSLIYEVVTGKREV